MKTITRFILALLALLTLTMVSCVKSTYRINGEEVSRAEYLEYKKAQDDFLNKYRSQAEKDLKEGREKFNQENGE